MTWYGQGFDHFLAVVYIRVSPVFLLYHSSPKFFFLDRVLCFTPFCMPTDHTLMHISTAASHDAMLAGCSNEVHGKLCVEVVIATQRDVPELRMERGNTVPNTSFGPCQPVNQIQRTVFEAWLGAAFVEMCRERRQQRTPEPGRSQRDDFQLLFSGVELHTDHIFKFLQTEFLEERILRALSDALSGGALSDPLFGGDTDDDSTDEDSVDNGSSDGDSLGDGLGRGHGDSGSRGTDFHT